MIVKLMFFGIISSACSQSLYHFMTPENLQKIFSVNSATEVPDYDVVPISITKPRNRRYTDLYLHAMPFGHNLKLWLTPTDGILAGENLPIWEFTRNPYNLYSPYIKKVNTQYLIPKIYENEAHASTLVINYHPNGQPSTTGYIGDHYIQPVPSHLMDHAKRQRRSLNISLSHESDDQIYHIVRKIPKLDMKIHSGSLNLSTIKQNITSRSKRSYPQQHQEANPKIIYPEILLINGVDMRYRSLESPRVRLNIAVIIFAEDYSVLPYMEVNTQGYVINADNKIEFKSKWLYHLQKFFRFDYDLAVTMFAFAMCVKGACRTLGLAYPGGVCNRRKVAFLTDRRAYDGIQSGAHKLGHLFGMVHDGDKNFCNDSYGYIMTRWNKFTPQAFDWSPCSLHQTDQLLKSGGGWCLRNYPNQVKPLPRYVPGRRMNAHQQCKKLVNGYATYIGDSICTQLQCLSYYNFALPEAAEGTPCGTGKLCLHGICGFEQRVV